MRYEAIEILGLHGAIVVVEGICVCIVVVYMRSALCPDIVPRRLGMRRLQRSKGTDVLRRDWVGHG